jgi:hypothetical protein
MMNTLQHDLEILSFLVGVQPSQVGRVFDYSLCAMMVEAGKMERVDVLPNGSSPIHVFQTVSGDTCSVERPPMSEEVEAKLITELRIILEEERRQ